MDRLSATETPLLPVEPTYRKVIAARLASFWAVLTVAAILLDRSLLADTALAWLPAVLVPLLGAAVVATAPQRIYDRLGYSLSDRFLRVVRGWLFHTDTIVPQIRVQHIDVTRGPLDKAFGTATLVVHTAGTHNSIVSLPGLSPARAAEIRDAIREHVRTDFA
jgi:uncharacterized protein